MHWCVMCKCQASLWSCKTVDTVMKCANKTEEERFVLDKEKKKKSEIRNNFVNLYSKYLRTSF